MWPCPAAKPLQLCQQPCVHQPTSTALVFALPLPIFMREGSFCKLPLLALAHVSYEIKCQAGNSENRSQVILTVEMLVEVCVFVFTTSKVNMSEQRAAQMMRTSIGYSSKKSHRST